MDAALYFLKAILLLDKKQDEKAVENLNIAINIAGSDKITATQAHCVLGEYFFTKREYEEAKKHLMWIFDNAEDLEQENDDLLNEEIKRANTLLSIIEELI